MASLSRELLKAAADEGDHYRALKAKNLAQLLARSDSRLPPDWERVYSLGIAMPIFIMELIWAVRAEARQTALKEMSGKAAFSSPDQEQRPNESPTNSEAQSPPYAAALRKRREVGLYWLGRAMTRLRGSWAGVLFVIGATVAADMNGLLF